MTTPYKVTLLDGAVADFQKLEDFAIESELASETPDWTTPQLALDAIREGMRLLTWSPARINHAVWRRGLRRSV